MALSLPVFGGTEYAKLPQSEREQIFATFPAPIEEGLLGQFPDVPPDSQLACLFQQGDLERLAIIDAWNDVDTLQRAARNSGFRWFIVDKTVLALSEA